MPDNIVEETYTEDEMVLGDAKWSTEFKNRLPDAAFAAIESGGSKDKDSKTTPRSLRHLPHHGQNVVKGTENGTVDKEHLRSALQLVSKTKISADLKTKAKSHLQRHARALGIGEEEIIELIGEDIMPEPTLREQIEALTTLEDAEVLLARVEDQDSEEILDATYQKILELAAVGREQFSDDFEGRVTLGEKKEDGSYSFTAVVAQADKTNKNRRLYPKKEFQNNLKRVNRLAKSGRFNGTDGHGGLFSSQPPSSIVVRYDSVFMQDNDLIMEGALIPTQAGQDIATLWDHGVQTEWSIVGYGNPEYKGEGKGEYAQINDYVLLGCDPVIMGAATTKTVKMTKNSLGEAVAAEVVADEVQNVEVVKTPPEETKDMADEIEVPTVVTDAPVVPPVPEPTPAPAPQVDVAAIAEATRRATQEAIAEAQATVKLQVAKDAAFAKLAEGDKMVGQVVAKYVNGATTVEEVATAVEEVAPLVAQLKKPKTVEGVGNFFIHQDKERARFMWNGVKAVDRPTTVQGVKDALLDGLEDNGKQDWSNMRFIMEAILKNYEATRENVKYLNSMTQQGFPTYEAATTTTSLGTTIPMVLPIIRSMLPQLIPYTIASVQPIDRPVSRAYFYDPIYKTGTNGAGADGSNIDDSAVFDTGWPDHTEADTKSQISFTFTHSDVTAVEKAVYWDYTSAVMQDVQAYYNLDVEASMMSAGVDVLAQSINMTFLETLAAGAGQSGTFNTGLPASGFDDLSVWLSWGLSQALNRASGSLAKKMGQPAGWIVTGPTQATLFEASNSYSKLPAGAVNEFGTGLRQVGSWSNLYDVYVCDWAETLTSLKNKMLIGYRPRNWDRSAAVFCPYVPLYVSPTDSVPSTNTMSHSVSSRNAYKVLQANGLYLLAIGNGTGSALTYTD